jgi:hypothetical protein
MATRRKDDDALGRLAEVMVEDILATPRIELLAEVAEDHGDARALSADFDRLAAPIVQRAEIGTTDAVGAERENPQRAGYPIGAIGPRQNFGNRTLISSLIGWLKALQKRAFSNSNGTLFLGSFQIATASLLVAAVIAGAAFLIVKEFSAANMTEEVASSTSPSRLQPSPQPGRSGDVHDADLATNPATYIVEVAEGRSAEEARTNYQVLQMKFPFILKARDPLILSSERVDEGGGRRYLAVAGPFATIEQARGLCDELKASGGQCITGEYSR